MNSNEVFIHIHQGCFAGTGAIVRLPQCQWSKPDGYGKISQCITTTKHSKAKIVCIFLGIYCIYASSGIDVSKTTVYSDTIVFWFPSLTNRSKLTEGGWDDLNSCICMPGLVSECVCCIYIYDKGYCQDVFVAYIYMIRVIVSVANICMLRVTVRMCFLNVSIYANCVIAQVCVATVNYFGPIGVFLCHRGNIRKTRFIKNLLTFKIYNINAYV